MAWDSIWEQIFSSGSWGKYPSEDLIRFVARNFYGCKARSDVVGLELGCGPGANLWYIAREGFSVAGIDGSETAIRHAEERLDNECPGWRHKGSLKVGDISKLPYDSASFDFAIDVEAVYCNSFGDSQQIYREAARVLKNGGLLFVRTFAEGCWGEGTGTQVGPNDWLCEEGPLSGKGYARFTNYEQLPILLEGFEILSTELLTRTMSDRIHSVKEWMVTAKKR